MHQPYLLIQTTEQLVGLLGSLPEKRGENGINQVQVPIISGTLKHSLTGPPAVPEGARVVILEAVGRYEIKIGTRKEAVLDVLNENVRINPFHIRFNATLKQIRLRFQRAELELHAGASPPAYLHI